jgi:hypothetical protein
MRASGHRSAMPAPRKKSGADRREGHLPRRDKSLNPRKANSFNMRELRVSGHVRRVGNSLALLIPVADAKKVGLAPGDPVDAIIQSGVPDAFGLLKDLPYRPFDRRKEGLWRDRL